MEQREKKKPNIVLYTLSMIAVFVAITELIIWGYGGRFIVTLIKNYPQGDLVISEAVLAIMVLVVMLIFKNHYVFTQKKEPLKIGLFYGMFYIIGIIIFSLLYGVLLGGFKAGLSVINLLMGCLLIGVCEEFLCRGWLLNEFLERFGDTKKGVWFSIVISGVIFGIMHIANIFSAGQEVSLTINQVINAIGPGILFGLIYYKTKNIWSVVLIHGLWDFSLMLGTLLPPEQTMEIASSYSVAGMQFTILIVLIQLINIIPYLDDIDIKPKKGTVIGFSIVSIILYIVFMFVSAFCSLKVGDLYKYGDMKIENYAVTRDNYTDYNIIYNDFNFNLNTNDDNNLVLTNTTTNYVVEIKCKELSDYIIMEDKDRFIIAYTEFVSSTNTNFKYIYLDKDKLSNDNIYLDNIKKDFHKYLLPSDLELVVLSDYKKGDSYVAAYGKDYGYYLLIDVDKMAMLNK